MTITEKAAYLRGLIEGQGLDPEAGEGKLWHVLAELVGDLAGQLSELQEEHDRLSDSVDELEVGLDYLEELLQEDYSDYDGEDEDLSDDDEDDYPFSSGHLRIVDEEEDDEDEEELLPVFAEEDDPDRSFYEVECPNCGAQIRFDDETLDEGSIQCPDCGAMLEFDIEDPGEEEPIVFEADPDGDDPEDN